ncbi:MAG: UDP-glucose/GDP-mannose dehydrogenase family protein [Candidatus Coatesbacteria bacterium]|nr:MAG: UDP-glucose/GDP-mannose dehydrogenase family protein [Candidatus Coatesbacteria bacterium]
MKVAVVGTGYVGLVTGACFADLGNQVICADIDERKIEMLREGETPIFEPGLVEMVRINAKVGRLAFTSDVAEAVAKSKVVFIAVGTPPGPDGEADLSQVRSVAETIGEAMDGYRIVVNKSTVPVGTGDIVSQIIAAKSGGAHPYDVVSNPEFLREGSAIHDFMQPDRVVIGCSNPAAADIVAELYGPLNAPIIVTDVLSAEMIKYTSNAFLALKISFINEIANICERVGADVREVVEGVTKDHRINPAFFGAGVGFGGSCFPKDTLALADIAAKAGYEFKILKAVIAVNDLQRDLFVAKIVERLGDLKGKKIAVWGLSFKPNTDDIRESPALDIIRKLLAGGATVAAFDPVASEAAQAELPEIEYVGDAYAAAKDADALAVVTDWNEFKEADFKGLAKAMRQPLLFDGRNIYEPAKVEAAGLEYVGVGRRSGPGAEKE